MTTATGQKGVITREELHASPQFLACTKMQQHWLDLVAFENVAPNQATSVAYNATDPVYCSMLTGKILSSRNIREALALVYGYSEKEKFLQGLEFDIRRSKGVARVAARQLFARVSGLIESEPGPETVSNELAVAAKSSESETTAKSADVKEIEDWVKTLKL